MISKMLGCKLFLNDLDPDCVQILKDNFKDPTQAEIFQGDARNLIWRDVDLVFIDFNSFTIKSLNEWAPVLSDAAKHSKDLIVTDSASYGFNLGNLKHYGCKDQREYYEKVSTIFEEKFSVILARVSMFDCAALLHFTKSREGSFDFIVPEKIPMRMLEKRRVAKILKVNTPVEKYQVKGREVFVKREDLCVPPPGPTFSKVRGLLKRLQLLKDKGYKTVGYTESSISMAGWGVAWLAPKVGLKAVIFDPQYSTKSRRLKHLDVLDFHRSKWKELGAEIIPVKAGMVKVNYYICKKILKERYPNSIMLPLGLPFEETIDETARISDQYKAKFKTVVVCVGSGTITAGLLRGLCPGSSIYGIMCRSGDPVKKRKDIIIKSGRAEGNVESLVDPVPIEFECIDPGWKYTDRSKAEAPFPCHPYYDLKAWEWLVENITTLEDPILFWNIGS